MCTVTCHESDVCHQLKRSNSSPAGPLMPRKPTFQIWIPLISLPTLQKNSSTQGSTWFYSKPQGQPWISKEAVGSEVWGKQQRRPPAVKHSMGSCSPSEPPPPSHIRVCAILGSFKESHNHRPLRKKGKQRDTPFQHRKAIAKSP